MAALGPPDSSHGPYPEKTRRVITATVKDENDVAIPGSSLLTMTWTLFTEHDASLSIINSRTAVDCKPNVSALGVLTLTLTPADMAILNDTVAVERHRLLFQWTYDTDGAGKYDAQILVKNMAKVS